MLVPDNELVRLIAYALVHFVWQGAAIGGMLWVVLHVARRNAPEVRYAASCVALGLMLMAPVATVLFALSSETVQVAADQSIVTRVHVSPLVETPPTSRGLHSAFSAAPVVYAWLVSVWLLAVGFLLIRMAGAWAYAVHITRSAVEGPAAWQMRVNELGMRMNLPRPVRLRMSKRHGPWVIGIIRPCILVPAALLTGLPAWHVEAILAHELAHVRRLDYLISVCQCVVETLLFYHPLVWWVSRQIRCEREYCCDELAAATCNTTADYARALVSLEELRPEIAAGAALAASGGSLHARIARLLDGERDDVRTSGGPNLVAAVLIMLALGIGLGACDEAARVVQYEGASSPNLENADDAELLAELARVRSRFSHLRDSTHAVIDEKGLATSDAPSMAAITEMSKLHEAYFRLLDEAAGRGIGERAVNAWDEGYLRAFIERYRPDLDRDYSWLPSDDPSRRAQEEMRVMIKTAEEVLEIGEAGQSDAVRTVHPEDH